MQKIKIGTHNGIFHADDAFAIAALRIINSLSEVEVVRTRDPKVLEGCDLLVDVGGVYAPFEGRFDHHQKPADPADPYPITPRENGVPYSSFGLVWRHYGHDCTGSMAVVAEVDRQLVQSVDAADCGFALQGKPVTTDARSLSVSAMVSLLNPTWEEGKDFDGAFARAVDLAEMVLRRAIASARAKVDAEKLVAAAAATPGPVMILDRYLPWASMEIAEHKLFCVFPAAENGTWMVQCVPDRPGSFGKRKALPEAWGGLRAADMAAMTGVEDSVFCHIGLFVCGAGSREGALDLARQACEA